MRISSPVTKTVYFVLAASAVLSAPPAGADVRRMKIRDDKEQETWPHHEQQWILADRCPLEARDHSVRRLVSAAAAFETSGVGRSSLLEPKGIIVWYGTPNIGVHLQDHILLPSGFKATPDRSSLESLRNEASFAESLGSIYENPYWSTCCRNND